MLGAGCGPLGEEPLGRESEAVNVCDETVPTNRFVDGLPAYAQCDTTTGSIWSNNGVDTATSKQGNDWVLTQQGGGYQCTEWAWRYMHFHFGIDYRHGDARQWCDGTLPVTLVTSTTPVHGDLIVFDAGVCGADATTGHIAVVDTVDAAKAKVTLVEENQAGRRTANQSCALCFLHAVANDGMSTGSAGAPGAAGASSGAGSANGGAAARGGAPSFAGATAMGGTAARAAGGALATAGRGTGGSVQAGGGGATNDGGRPGSADGGAPNAGTTGRGGASGTGVSTVGGTSGTLMAGGAAGAGSMSTAGAGHGDVGEGGPRGDGLPSDSANPGAGCQLGSRTPGGGAGFLLALAYWVAVRKRRFSGRRVAA